MASTFDHIIVGAGSAGCVLANRLTASGRHRVLLLEAGGTDRNIWIHIPLGYGKLFNDPKVNWLYSTEPEPDLNNRNLIQPRGKVLGCVYRKPKLERSGDEVHQGSGVN